MKGRLVTFGLASALFLADRGSKIFIDRNVAGHDLHVVIPGFFNIVHSENRGMAFSLLSESDGPLRDVLLIGVSGVVLVFVAGMLWRASAGMQRVALTLVLGGASGNLYDRVARGSVTDFLDFYVGGYHWPAFNLADSAITVGAILIGLEILGVGRPKAS